MASEISSSERGTDWANLLPEILASIAIRLAALDYLNFSAVCTSWASLASPRYGMPPPLPLRKQRPLLLMRGDDGEQNESITLLDIFDNPRRSYKIGQLPEIGGKWFVGSQFGWVALVDELSNPSLLNPFTRAHIELPPITTLPDLTPIYDSNGYQSGFFYPPWKKIFSLKVFRSICPFRKIVLSSDPADGNFTAAAIFGLCKLIFLRPGEKAWTYWYRNIREPIIEVMYRGSKFLALTASGKVYEIDPFDLSVKGGVLSTADQQHSSLGYLIDSPGGLLHVYRRPEELPRHRAIEVWRLDPETDLWVPVPSLGDHALFIGSSCGMSLRAGNGVKPPRSRHRFFLVSGIMSGKWAARAALGKFVYVDLPHEGREIFKLPPPVDHQVWECYEKQVQESDGFDVGSFPELQGRGTIIVPVDCSKFPATSLLYAIDEHNKGRQAQGRTSISLARVLKLNCRLYPGPDLFYTFVAKDDADGAERTYQAETRMAPDKFHVIIFREKSSY